MKQDVSRESLKICTKYNSTKIFICERSVTNFSYFSDEWFQVEEVNVRSIANCGIPVQSSQNILKWHNINSFL